MPARLRTRLQASMLPLLPPFFSHVCFPSSPHSSMPTVATDGIAGFDGRAGPYPPGICPHRAGAVQAGGLFAKPAGHAALHVDRSCSSGGAGAHRFRSLCYSGGHGLPLQQKVRFCCASCAGIHSPPTIPSSPIVSPLPTRRPSKTTGYSFRRPSRWPRYSCGRSLCTPSRQMPR